MGPKKYVGSAAAAYGAERERAFACGRCGEVYLERRFPGGGDLCESCTEDWEFMRTTRALWVLLVVTLIGIAVFALMAWRAWP